MGPDPSVKGWLHLATYGTVGTATHQVFRAAAGFFSPLMTGFPARCLAVPAAPPTDGAPSQVHFGARSLLSPYGLCNGALWDDAVFALNNTYAILSVTRQPIRVGVL